MQGAIEQEDGRLVEMKLVEELKLSSREMPPLKTENINHGGYDFLKNW